MVCKTAWTVVFLNKTLAFQMQPKLRKIDDAVCLFNKRAGKAYKRQILSGVGTVRENQLPT